MQEGAGSDELRAALEEWLPVKDNGMLSGPAASEVAKALGSDHSNGVPYPAQEALSFLKVQPAGICAVVNVLMRRTSCCKHMLCDLVHGRIMVGSR